MKSQQRRTFCVNPMWLIFICVMAICPALAQRSPITYNITCSSATACKKGAIPLYVTAGGASKVSSAIMTQAGTTINVAGTVNANTSFELGGTPFAFGSVSNLNALLGFAGNSTMTGASNTAVGVSALSANSTGKNNSALGASALTLNTTGYGNSAFGDIALNANTTGNQNSAFGNGAMYSNTTGSSSAAFGLAALYTNTTGYNNSSFGYAALYGNTIGYQNEAFGYEAMFKNTTGNGNAAFGTGALYTNTTGGSSSKTGGNSAFGNFALLANTTAGGNSAFGFSALTANTTGANTVAVGSAALAGLTTGSGNVAIGTGAGGNLSGSESNNIYVGNSGISGESNAIRIGYIGTATAAYIAGISGETSSNGVEVFINGAGQLGTTTSSRRFKHQIGDMGAESDVLMKLRPVSFYYKPEIDQAQTRQYGLVAEEVAEVAPQLVVFDKDGSPQTVRYHFVNAMLLNEVQKQHRVIEEQADTIARQQEEMHRLAEQLDRIETLLAGKR